MYRLLLLLNPAICVGILLGLLNIIVFSFVYPYLPYDFGYYVPRILDNYLFYKKNGFAIQYFSPTFSGGLPSYPNPQQTQFSIITALLFLFNPLISIYIYYFIMSFLSGVFGYILFYFRFGFNKSYSILASFILGTCGFIAEHFHVGHIFFTYYAITPSFVYLITASKFSLKNSVLLALMIAYAIYNAGFYPLFIVINSTVISSALYFHIFQKPFTEIKASVLTFLVGIGIGIGIGASKLCAMFLHYRFFPRNMDLNFNMSLYESIIFNFKQLFLFQGFGSVGNTEMLMSWIASKIPGWELHETDVSLSPIILILSSIAIYNYYKKYGILSLNKLGKEKYSIFLFQIEKRDERWSVSFKELMFPYNITFSFIVLLCVFCFSMSNTFGILFEICRTLPVLKSFNSNMRFTAIFVVPIVFLVFYYLNDWKYKITLKFLILCLAFGSVNYVITYAKSALYYKNKNKTWPFSLDIKNSIVTWEMINNDINYFKIERVANVEDQYGHLEHASTLNTYEPLFGFWPGNWKPAIEKNHLNPDSNGYYPLTHPASVVFPEMYNLKLWEKIPLSDSANFNKFINYKIPDWEIPKKQLLCNNISVLFLVVSFIILFIPTLILKNGF